MKKKLAAIFLILSLLAGVPVFSAAAAPSHKTDCIDLDWARSAETLSAETQGGANGVQGASAQADVPVMPAGGSLNYEKVCADTPMRYFDVRVAQSTPVGAAGGGVWDCGGYTGNKIEGDVREWATWPAGNGTAETLDVRRFSSRFVLEDELYYMLETAMLAPEDELGSMSYLLPVSGKIYVFVNGRPAWNSENVKTRGGAGGILDSVYPYAAGRCIDLESSREAMNIQPYLVPGENRIDVIVAGQGSGGMSKLKLYCGHWPTEPGAKEPAYVVFAVDASDSMDTADIAGQTRLDTARKAISDYIGLLGKAPYANIEKRFALVSYGTGARVYVSAEDAAGKFSGLETISQGNDAAAALDIKADNFIGMGFAGADEALADFNSIADKTALFYSGSETLLDMLSRISGDMRGCIPPSDDDISCVNAEAGISLAHSLLKAAPANAKKMIVFISGSESTASSSFYSLYNKAEAGKKILNGTLEREGGALVVTCEGISEAVTAEDFALIGKDETAELTALSEAEANLLKLRAMARSMDFYTLLTRDIEINPFAGEVHAFDAMAGVALGGDLIITPRVNPTPDFSRENDINGYYWSKGLVAEESLYYYYSRSEYFRKNENIWQFSANGGKDYADIYTDKVFARSATAGSLGSLTFNNSDAELMMFASEEKAAGSRMIDYYGKAAKSAAYGSDAAKRFMMAAAARARADEIEIQAVGIGGQVLLPEYLHKVDSKGAAFIVNGGTVGLTSALTRKLFEFTNVVFGF